MYGEGNHGALQGLQGSLLVGTGLAIPLKPLQLPGEPIDAALLQEEGWMEHLFGQDFLNFQSAELKKVHDLLLIP